MPNTSIETRLARLERQNQSLRRALLGMAALGCLSAVLVGRPAISQQPPSRVTVGENGIVIRSAAGTKVSEWAVDENGDVKLVFYGRAENERVGIEVNDGEAWLSMNDETGRTRMLIRTGAAGASDIRFNSDKSPVASLSVDETGEAFLGVTDDNNRGLVARAGKGGGTLRLDRPDGSTWVPR